MLASNTIIKCMSALEKHQWDTAASTLADDFTSNGWLSQPLGKEDWLAICRSLAQAVPDRSYGFQVLREYGSTVWGVIRFSGTHTGELALFN